MIKEAINVDFEKLKKFFKGYKNIISVFIFGSAQLGIIKPESDLDIAIFFTKIPDSEEKLMLYSKLCSTFEYIEKIDMIILNDVDPILGFEAISGYKLLDKKPEETAVLCSYISRVYEDTTENINWQYKLRTKD